MHATAWHNGSTPQDPAGYGLKFVERDRDRYFNPEWKEAIFDLEDGKSVSVTLSPSFWSTCKEVRSSEIGSWLIEAGAAPWLKGSPPGVVVTTIEDNRFSARILKRKTLGGRA